MGIFPSKCLLGRYGMNILLECCTLISASSMYMDCSSSPAKSKSFALIPQLLNFRKGFKNTDACPC